MAEDIVNKVFSLFTGDKPPDSDKAMLLKQTHKELGQNKYARFFRIKSEEADPSLASFLYAIYKVTYPIKLFVQNEEKMGRLRQIILEAFMDSAIVDTVKRLSPQAIQQQAGVAATELTAQIHGDIVKLTSAFDEARIDGANRCYNLVAALAQLVNFNFSALLKRFDSAFAEGQFSAEPKFSPVRADLIAKDIGEFLVVSQALTLEGDWKNLMDLLKLCAGKELVQPELFSRLVGNLRDIHQSKILELIVQYALKNPVWAWKPRLPDEHIGEEWLEAQTGEAQNTIDQINYAQKSSQINALVKQIFESAELVRLGNYTVDKGEIFRKKNLDDFMYAEGLNYLRVFLEDYLEKEFRELCDLLLIRGQWTNNIMSKEMSEALHQLLEASTPILALDETLSEDGSDGSRLRAAVLRVDRDKTQVRYINSIIGNTNEEALEMINNAAQEFIVIGKHLKSLIDDVQKKHADLMINWRELNLYSKTPLAQRMVDDYKKINYFVQLMRLCTQ